MGVLGRLRVKGYSWDGRTKRLKAEYLPEKNNGFYTSAGTEDEPIAAFEKTLDCPMLSGTHWTLKRFRRRPTDVAAETTVCYKHRPWGRIVGQGNKVSSSKNGSGRMTNAKSQHRPSDFGNQLLTALTILLSVLLFVAAPLQANGVLRHLGLDFSSDSCLSLQGTLYRATGSPSYWCWSLWLSTRSL